MVLRVQFCHLLNVRTQQNGVQCEQQHLAVHVETVLVLYLLQLLILPPCPPILHPNGVVVHCQVMFMQSIFMVERGVDFEKVVYIVRVEFNLLMLDLDHFVIRRLIL